MKQKKLDKALELLAKLAEKPADLDIVREAIEFLADLGTQCDYCLGPMPCYCENDE